MVDRYIKEDLWKIVISMKTFQDISTYDHSCN